MIFLLGSVKLKIGFALGLFAIFGIIRYRTESMPVREMTYLFVIIAISVINALSVQLSNKWMKHTACKLVQYDRIDLIKPEKELEMVADLRERTGLDIYRVEVGSIDFLRDMTILKVYYVPENKMANTVDGLVKLPKEGE